MPTVTKQGRLVNKSSSNGATVLGQAVPVGELSEDYIKLVLYGQNRVGKTTIACQFPKPLLLISFEPGATGGSRSIKKIPGVSYIRLQSTADALQLANELRTDKTYKTHVLDTVTSCQDLVLRELMNLSEAPVQLNWGTVSRDIYRERSEKTREVLRPFCDLPAHTVFVAQEKDHNPPRDDTSSRLTRGLQQESFFAADLGGATVKWLQDACGYIVRLYLDKGTETVRRSVKIGKEVKERVEEVETGKLVRRLRTMYHPNYAAGIRSENPDEIPEYIEAVRPEEMYAKLMKLIRGEGS